MSTPRLKLWEGATDDAIVVVLGCSGTRLDAADDVLCDLKSQIAQPHVNMLDERLPRLGNVGAGWQEWWQSEAQLPRTDGAVMKDVLTRYADRAKGSGKALSISLTGHSLGAAVATVAGFDIAHFLRADGVSGNVSVYAFNPPRLGQAGIETLYMDTLKSNYSALRFALRQFVRALDPIQSTPLLMHHPHWDHDSAAAAERAGNASGDRFAQFVTSTDQPASRINLAYNHELTLWRLYISVHHPTSRAAAHLRSHAGAASDIYRLASFPQGPARSVPAAPSATGSRTGQSEAVTCVADASRNAPDLAWPANVATTCVAMGTLPRLCVCQRRADRLLAGIWSRNGTLPSAWRSRWADPPRHTGMTRRNSENLTSLLRLPLSRMGASSSFSTGAGDSDERRRRRHCRQDACHRSAVHLQVGRRQWHWRAIGGTQ